MWDRLIAVEVIWKSIAGGSAIVTIFASWAGMLSFRAVNETFPVSPPRAWTEIDLGALRRNLAVARA